MLMWWHVRRCPLMRAAGTVKTEVLRKGFYTNPSTTDNKTQPTKLVM